jgi:hypothetical protein
MSVDYDTFFSIGGEELPPLSPRPSSNTSRCTARNGDEEGEIVLVCKQQNFEFNKDLKLVCTQCGMSRKSSATKKAIRKKCYY